jgi:molybdopterin-guanine dinucleotide biosynthesis protein A
MGQDKAAMAVQGERLAVRTARLLAAVARPCLEVGKHVSGLESVEEPEPGEGPLSAVAAGWLALRGAGYGGPVLIVATDLPRLTAAALGWLAGRPEAESVVPVIGDHAQPLCARWSAEDLERAVVLCRHGERKVRAALGPATVYLGPASFAPGISAENFSDADTPEDLERLTQSP